MNFAFPSEYNYEGYVWKTGEVNTAWQKRFCCFEGDELAYYRTQAKREKQGVIALKEIEDISWLELYQGRNDVFAIRLPNRTYYFSGEDDGKTTPFWVQAILKLKEHVQKLPPSFYLTSGAEGFVPDFDQSPYPPATISVNLDAASMGIPNMVNNINRVIRTSSNAILRKVSTPSDLKLGENSARKSPTISPRK